jgi:hypothetical protein
MLAAAAMPVTSGRHGGLGGLAAVNWTAVQAQSAAAAPGDASQWNHITEVAYHTAASTLAIPCGAGGYNADGELGIGNTAEQDLPQQVTTPAPAGWATVTAGSVRLFQHPARSGPMRPGIDSPAKEARRSKARLTRELTRTLKCLALPEVTERRCPAGQLPGPLSYRGGRQTLPAPDDRP